MDSANCPECHTQFSRKDNMTRHYKYRHGIEHQLPPHHPPPHKVLPLPPHHHQKGEGLRPFEPLQETVNLPHSLTLHEIGCTGS